MKQLKSASGKEFDRKFLAFMAEEHRRDIKLLRSYEANGSDPAVKSFALRALPTFLGDGAYAGDASRMGRCCDTQMRANRSWGTFMSGTGQ